MSQQLIGVGTVPMDGTGDSLRVAFMKINANETELYNKGGTNFTASGTRWYIPRGMDVQTASGTAQTASTIVLVPVGIGENITISNLRVRISTLAAGGNFQLAIYASDPTTKLPIGAALISTASVSTAATGGIGAAAALTLAPGLYWIAVNCDNSTVAFNSVSNTSLAYAQLVGISNSGNLFGTVTGLTIAQTFGTWPTFTGGSSFAEVTTAIAPIVGMQISAAN